MVDTVRIAGVAGALLVGQPSSSTMIGGGGGGIDEIFVEILLLTEDYGRTVQIAYIENIYVLAPHVSATTCLISEVGGGLLIRVIGN